MRPPMCVALDIGGTSVKGSIGELREGTLQLSEVASFVPASNTVVALENAVVGAIEHFAGGSEDGLRVGIATHGMVDKRGSVLFGPFYEGYREYSWSRVLNRRLDRKVTVTVLNDGQAAALGAYVEEIDPRVQSFVMLVVGTGVGGGVVCGGRLLTGANGFAGHVGHISIPAAAGLHCSCGLVGCAEMAASGSAIASELIGRPAGPGEVGRIIRNSRDGVLSGDAQILNAYRAAGSALGEAIGSISNLLDPEIVMIGGGIVDATKDHSGQSVFVEAARASVRTAALAPIAEHSTVSTTSLTNANLYGAAANALRSTEG
jgi:glucokinase